SSSRSARSPGWKRSSRDHNGRYGSVGTCACKPMRCVTASSGTWCAGSRSSGRASVARASCRWERTSAAMPDSMEVSSPTMAGDRNRYDAVVAGAGFAGMFLAYKLRDLGLQFRVYEVGDDVGGTWYWNRYPGARCDVESLEYSYQFSDELQQEWEWTERYAGQPEILRYANHVVDRFALRDAIQCNTRVPSAELDEATGRWHVSTDTGDE